MEKSRLSIMPKELRTMLKTIKAQIDKIDKALEA